jgi:hypothetical protein
LWKEKKAVKVREVNWIQGGCNTMEGSNFLILLYIFFKFLFIFLFIHFCTKVHSSTL